MAEGECIWCKIVRKEINSLTVYEDDFIIAFLDINPQGKGHTIVVPKEHRYTITDFSEAAAANFFKLAYKIAFALMKVTGAKSVIINNGNPGSPITHSYFQVIPWYGSPAENQKTVEEMKKNPASVTSLLTEIKNNILPCVTEKAPAMKVIEEKPVAFTQEIADLRKEIQEMKARIEGTPTVGKKVVYTERDHWI